MEAPGEKSTKILTCSLMLLSFVRSEVERIYINVRFFVGVLVVHLLVDMGQHWGKWMRGWRNHVDLDQTLGRQKFRKSFVRKLIRATHFAVAITTHREVNPHDYEPRFVSPRMDSHNLEPTTDWKFFIQRNFTCSFTLFPQQKFPMFFGESASPGAKHQTWRRASNLEAPKDGRDGYKLHSVFHRGDGKNVKSDEFCLLAETSTYQEVYWRSLQLSFIFVNALKELKESWPFNHSKLWMVSW